MAMKCPACSSPDTQTGLNNNQCLRCGKLFDFEGNTVEAGAGDTTRQAILERLAPRQQVVVGNLADLQRAGAEAAAAGRGNLGNGVALPPGEGLPHEVVTPAEAEAAQGRVTVETERAGTTKGEPEPVATAAAPKATKSTKATKK